MTEQATQARHDELARIAKLNDGILRPADVVAEAADPESPLHSAFQWDDHNAAHEYRLAQARHVIRAWVTLVPQAEKNVRAYVSLVDDRSNEGGGYRDIQAVLTCPEHRSALLDQAKSEARAWQMKYRVLKELVPVFQAMDEVFQLQGEAV